MEILHRNTYQTDYWEIHVLEVLNLMWDFMFIQ